ncbi:MAG: hypothetical protein EHM17_16015 [Verrucomicrobiaceae bacterium]|nr:MAG: hypothetical protein EHM17_16015 [Verrucomicrobiaceae bacterium]
MSDLRTAAQQALKSLRGYRREISCEQSCDAERALEAALGQPEQEPVAWMVYTQDGKSVCVTDNPADFIEWRSFPLYTHPPRREPLTVTELQQALIAVDLVDQDAIDDPEGYDGGWHLGQIDALHKRLTERNA